MCDSCHQLETSGVEGAPCSAQGCGGSLVEIEVVTLAAALEWRHDRESADEKADEKVSALQSKLAQTLFGSPRQTA